MSLDPLHEQIARIAFALPEAGQVALAGGGAMLAHDLVDRPTQDVDLFTPDPAEVTRLTDALAVALRAEGAQVRVDRRGPGFTRLAVTVADGRSVVVEIAHDARIREAVQLSFGRVLHPDEVAADKTLALFGRAAATGPGGCGGAVRAVHARAAVRASRRKGRRFRPPGFRRRVGRRRSSLGRRLCRTRLRAGDCRRPTGERGWMARPTAGCRGHVRHGRCAVRRRTDAAGVGGFGLDPALRDHLNVIGRRLPTPVETAHRCPAESAGIIGSRGAGWVFADRLELLGLALLFPVVASGHQLVHDLLTGWRGEP